jgi:hypothetical protein
MESEHSHQFNERLSQWVSSQGLWFQIRYSLSGSGGAGKAFFHLLWVSFRLLVLLLIIAAGVGFYLLRRTNTKDFSKNLNASLRSGLAASELEVSGPKKEGGDLSLNQVVALGNGKTFFNSLDAKNVRCKMGLLDGFVGKWDTGNISISRLEMELCPGTDDEKSSKLIGDVLFNSPEKVTMSSLEIQDASLFWGYSAKTRGAIQNSHVVARRLGDTWKLDFKGGVFTQNWLQQLDIEHLSVTCNREGMVFEKAQLRKGGGTVDFSGLKLIGGALPAADGIVKVRLLDLEQILATAQNGVVEGKISGDFKVTGSTNSSEGIGFSGKVMLNSGEESLTSNKDLLGADASIILSDDDVPVLKALSVVDSVRDYRRTNFLEGSFNVKTSNSVLQLSEIQLESDYEMTNDKVKVGHVMKMKGSLNVRPASKEEILATDQAADLAIAQADRAKKLKGSSSIEEKEDSLNRIYMDDDSKTGAKFRKFEGKESLTARVTKSLDAVRKDWKNTDRFINYLQYEGSLDISLLPNAFDQAEALKMKHPVDPATGRIQITIPVKGSLGKLTSSQAEEIYREGQRKN